MSDTKASISDFAEEIDPYGIYGSRELSEDFTKATGEEPCWPTKTVKQARAAIASSGCGGHVVDVDGSPVVFGYEAIIGIADKHAVDRAYRNKRGRGTKSRLAIESLRKAGK